MDQLSLGTKVVDSVTGFIGTLTARITYQHRSPQVLVEGLDSLGRPSDLWTDEQRLKLAPPEPEKD